jgi:hypothetical protein
MKSKDEKTERGTAGARERNSGHTNGGKVFLRFELTGAMGLTRFQQL